MSSYQRIRWSEQRLTMHNCSELFFFIAERPNDHVAWEISERSSFEVSWHVIPLTEQIHIRIAVELRKLTGKKDRKSTYNASLIEPSSRPGINPRSGLKLATSVS